VLNYRLIQDEDPAAASMTSYLTPVVALMLGIVVVSERLSWNLIDGTVVVLLAVWIAERKGDGSEPAARRSRAADGQGRPHGYGHGAAR
jgi:drug/metabolite transporter (DMT)-like permease